MVIHLTAPQPAQSPLARLVLFMICLSIAGTIVSGIHYLAIDRPQQENALQAPMNSGLCTISTFASCAKYGSLCYECITMGEYSYGCEMSSSEKMQICGTPYTPKSECDSQGLCKEV